MATDDTLIHWDADQAKLPAADYATRDVTADEIPVLDYDDAASPNEYALFVGVMPGQYDGSTALTVKFGWKFTTYVGSQTCDWEISWCRVDDDTQSIESLTFATAQVVLATEASAVGELDYAEINFTNAQADGIQPGEMFVVKVLRDATGGTASPGDAELAFVEVDLQ
jgi:hypothetical protein